MIDGLHTLAKRLLRSDAWSNPFSGFGTSRDKTTFGSFAGSQPIDDQQLSDLFNGMAIAAKVVSLLPDESMRQGITLKAGNPQHISRLQRKFRELDAATILTDADRWGRLYGGAAVYLGAGDGQEDRVPLDFARTVKLSYLECYDRRRASPIRWYENESDPRFGFPEIYLLTHLKGGSFEVHETRLILFGGAKTPLQEKVSLNYWDYSVLQKCYEALRQWDSNNKAAEIMLSEASIGVFKMKGLIAKIAAGLQADINTRAALLDMGKSMARSIFLDADNNESFERVSTAFGGVADMLDRSANRLASESDIPVTKLIGSAPAGLNATGAADVRNWYDTVKSHQEQYLQPRYERLIRLCEQVLGLPVGEVSIEWPSLWQESPQERALRKKTNAETDLVYLDRDVLTPDEIAIGRFSGEEYSDDIKVNVEARPKLPANVFGGPKKAPPGLPAKPTNPNNPDEMGPPQVDQGPKPGGGRFPNSVGPTTGNPWPIPAVKGGMSE